MIQSSILVPSPTPKPSAGSSQDEIELSEYWREMDSLSILPLSIIPLETASLKRARLLKDASLESFVELFHDLDAGSGRVYPSQLGQVFDWPPDQDHPDLATIKALSGLFSYDVFSLRLELRRLNICVDDHSDLRLSEAKNRELTKYMTVFTRPLVQQIYGSSDARINDINGLIAMFSKPNKAEALKNLSMMTQELNIRMEEVPIFLEEYGDIFLSLAYFRNELDEIIPITIDLILSLRELKLNYQLSRDKRFLSACDNIETNLSDVISSITRRFENFDRHSQTLWKNITAESFRRVKELITGHHTTIDGVLCGLKVTMNAWNERFGGGQGGPIQHSDFIMSELKQGIDVITGLENKARKIVVS